MHEHRGQYQGGNGIGPIEHPIKPIQPAAERKRKHAKQRNTEPKEVQGRRGSRPSQSDRYANEKCEHPDGHQHEVNSWLPHGDRTERHLNQTLLSKP